MIDSKARTLDSIKKSLLLFNIPIFIYFNVIEIDKPYINSPYANFVSDHYKFMKKLIFRTDDVFAFWGSSMNLIAQKPL